MKVTGNGQRVAGRSYIRGNIVSSGDVIEINGTVLGAGPGRQGNGQRTRTRREVPAFDEISLQSCVDLVVTFGDSLEVVIETDDNLQDLIVAKVEAGILRLDIADSLTTQQPIVAEVRLPTPLRTLLVGGSGAAEVRDIDTRRLDLTVQGSGDIRVTGRIEQLSATVQGSGDIDLAAAVVTEAELLVQGSGDITAHVTRRVAAVVQGSGDISISGNPPQRNARVVGSGDIDFV